MASIKLKNNFSQIWSDLFTQGGKLGMVDFNLISIQRRIGWGFNRAESHVGMLRIAMMTQKWISDHGLERTGLFFICRKKSVV